MIPLFKRYVSRELTRCQRNLDRGGSPGFWPWRLRPVLANIDSIAAALRERIGRLEDMERAAVEIELRHMREREVMAELERGAREASVTLKAGEDA